MEAKAFLTQAQPRPVRHMYSGSPSISGPGLGGDGCWLCIPAAELKSLRIPQAPKGGASNLPTICPGRKDHFHYASKETNLPSAPGGDTVSLFQGCLLY